MLNLLLTLVSAMASWSVLASGYWLHGVCSRVAICGTMPRLGLNSRQKVILLHNAGNSIKCIEDRLKEERTVVTRQSLQRLVKKHQETGMYKDLFRRKRDKKVTEEIDFAINNELDANDEATTRQLRNTLVEKYPRLNVSSFKIKRKRKQLGWVCTRLHYCQLTRELNKVKRVVWCKEQLIVNEDFPM